MSRFYQLPPIPYFQTTRVRVQTMIDLAHITPGQRAADLGAGDGRIVIALARAGAVVTGYETDEVRASLAEKNSKQTQLTEEQARIIRKDFWQEDLSGFDVITVYPMPDILQALETKLLQELQSGSRVLLNYYQFPHWQPETTKEHVTLYIRP